MHLLLLPLSLLFSFVVVVVVVAVECGPAQVGERPLPHASPFLGFVFAALSSARNSFDQARVGRCPLPRTSFPCSLSFVVVAVVVAAVVVVLVLAGHGWEGVLCPVLLARLRSSLSLS